MTHTVIQPDSTTPLIGASGAISGVLGAFLIYNPKARITLIPDPVLIYLLRRLTIRVPAWVFILIWFFLQLHFTTNPSSSTIAFWAHIGGFLMGGTMALAVYKYLPKERFYAARKIHYDCPRLQESRKRSCANIQRTSEDHDRTQGF